MNDQPTLLDVLATQRNQTTPSRWLLGHLIAAGHLTESGLGRRARLRKCTCKAHILAGLDDDVAAFETACDPIPLNPLGEALALVEHRRTYLLRKDGKGYVLDHRHAAAIARRPAGTTPRADVIRQHRCNTPDIPEQLTLPTSYAEARPALPPNARPDF